MTTLIKSNVTEDCFLGDRLLVKQPAKGYRAGVDAVLLGAAVRADAGGKCRLLDVGAGVGTAGLCAAARLPGLSAVLLEREAELVALAEQNIDANGLGKRVEAAEGVVGAGSESLRRSGLEAESFDCAIANPPFHDAEAGTLPPNGLKANAHAMPANTLDHWLRFMARMVRPGGRAIVIHKVDALPELLRAFGSRFGKIRVLPVAARAGEPAIRVIVDGIKGSRAPMTLLAPFVLHDARNGFTPAASAILRHGGELPF